MIICDSCKAVDKIQQANAAYPIVMGESKTEIHLCWQCYKDFEKMAMALRHVIARIGADATLTHLYKGTK